MGNEKLTTLARRLRPFFMQQVADLVIGGSLVEEGPDIDLVTTATGIQVGRGGDTILLFKADGGPVQEYAASAAGFTACVAALETGDTIDIQSHTISLTGNDTITVRCCIRGKSRENSILTCSNDADTLILREHIDLHDITIKNTYSGNRNAVNCDNANSYVIAIDSYIIANGASDSGHAMICTNGYFFGQNVLFDSFHRNAFYVAGTGKANARACIMQVGSDANYGCIVAGGSAEILIHDSRCYIWNAGSGWHIRNDGGTIKLSSVQYDHALYSLNTGTTIYMQGDRGAYFVEDYHAYDIEASALTRHTPLPGAAGNFPISDGTNWTTANISAYSHDAVTLDADADAIFGLTGQQLTVDSENANTVLAGPASGAAADPTFRALVEADIDEILPLTKLSDVDTTGVGTGNIIYKSSGDWVDYPLGIGTAFANEEGRIKIGDVVGGNYLEVNNTTGEVTLIGTATAFKDLEGALIGKKLDSPASHITEDVDEGALIFDDSCTLTDHVTINHQINHEFVVGGDAYPHIHWWQTSSDVPNWLIAYRWQVQGAERTDTWTNLAWDHHIFTYNGETALNQITDFPVIPAPDGAGLSDVLQIRLYRDTGNDSDEFDGLDPLAGDVSATSLDCHLEVDSFGSYTEYTKSRVEFRLTEGGDFRLTESGDKRVIE